MKTFFFIFIASIIQVFNQQQQRNEEAYRIKDPYCVSLIDKGLTVKNATNQQYTEAFIQGPCPPIVLIPGYLGTKLEFKMTNATLFKESHPEIIEACEWKNLKAPEIQKFNLWINTDIDFMALAFEANQKAKNNKKKIELEHIPKLFKKIKINDSLLDMEIKPKCFGFLFRNYFSFNENKLIFEPLKGAKIQPVLTKKDKCGSDSISNFLDQYSSFVPFTKGFNDLIANFEKLGYKNGLSLFAFPYDWRLPPQEHIEKLNKTINLAYAITKKKSVLLGHSMGGLIAYLQSLKHNLLVERVITIGTPFLGSSGAFASMLNNDHQFNFKKEFKAMMFEVELETNMDDESLKLFTSTSANILTFNPKKIVGDSIDGKIMDSVKDLFPNEQQKEFCKSTINYLENKTPPICQVPLDYFYQEKRILKGENHLSFDTESHLVDFINEHKYFSEEDVLKSSHDSFLEGNSLFKLMYSRHLEKENKDIFTFKNPNVDFMFIYANHLPVLGKYDLNSKKAEKSMSGDGTVDSLSQIYPGLRWISEQSSNKSEDKKNIHFIEYCAFSTSHSQNTFNSNMSQYISLTCDCNIDNSSPIENCNHSTMINDKKLVQFIEMTIKSKNYQKQIVHQYLNLYEREFTDDLYCKNLFK